MGLARFNTQQNQQSMAKIVGTYAYLAPEVFFNEKFTDKSDILY
jgi:serine/threonine protein kinase